MTDRDPLQTLADGSPLMASRSEVLDRILSDVKAEIDTASSSRFRRLPDREPVTRIYA